MLACYGKYVGSRMSEMLNGKLKRRMRDDGENTKMAKADIQSKEVGGLQMWRKDGNGFVCATRPYHLLYYIISYTNEFYLKQTSTRA